MRFAFADRVAVQFAMRDFGDTEAERAKSIEALKDKSVKVIWLANTVFHHYTETMAGGLELGEPEPLVRGLD